MFGVDHFPGHGQVVAAVFLGCPLDDLAFEQGEKQLDALVKKPVFIDQKVKPLPGQGDEVQSQNAGHGPDARAGMDLACENGQADIHMLGHAVPRTH